MPRREILTTDVNPKDGLSRRQFVTGTLGGLALLSAKLAHAEPAAAPATPVARPGIERVILDVDPGNDDALAMLLALDAPTLHVEAVTVCPGNLGPDYAQQVRNALYIVDIAGKSGQVPVHAGMTHSILNKPYPIASFIHGKFGLGRVRYPSGCIGMSDHETDQCDAEKDRQRKQLEIPIPVDAFVVSGLLIERAVHGRLHSADVLP